MRLYAAVLVSLLALPATGQFSETLEVRVLEIEATVVDAKGETVDTLTRDDFEVALDGKRVEIADFFLVRRGAIEEPSAAPASSEAPPPLVAVPTRIIIVVDDVHLHPNTKVHALNALHDYIARIMDPWTTAMLVTWDGKVETRVKPTTRRDVLLAGLKDIADEMPRAASADAEFFDLIRLCQVVGAACVSQIPHYASSRAADVDRTITALREVIAAVAGMEGRKVIYFVSEGMAAVPGIELTTYANNRRGFTSGPMHVNKGPDLKRLARTAQDAGVVFNTIDPSMPVGAGGSVETSNFDMQQYRENARDSGRLLAKETGGRLIAGQNDLQQALAVLDDQVSTYYSIGVRVPSDAGKDVDVRVRVKNQPKLRVLTATRRNIPSREEAITNAVRSRLYLRKDENPLEARVALSTERSEGRCTAMLQILVPSSKLILANGPVRGNVDVRLAVLDEQGQESEVFRSMILVTSKHGAMIPHGIPLRIGSGMHTVSLALVDRATGVASYVQREVECGE